MKLIRTPPVAAVASTAAVSMANSDVPDAFGMAPPPHPPPIIVLSATPFIRSRWSSVLPPCALSASVLGPVAPPTSVTAPKPSLTFTPVMSTPTENELRDVGRDVTTSWPSTVCRVAV
jgi:hypothetical protein